MWKLSKYLPINPGSSFSRRKKSFWIFTLSNWCDSQWLRQKKPYKINVLKQKTINTLTHNIDSLPCLAPACSVDCQILSFLLGCVGMRLCLLNCWGGTLAWGLIQQFTLDCLWMHCHDLFGERCQPAGFGVLLPPC